jgi:pilus assembly protein Flp/PilA
MALILPTLRPETASSGKPDVCGCPNVEVFMYNSLTRFLRDESGATAIEYGLIAALIAVVIIGTLTAIGTNLSTKFNSVATSLH